MKRVHTGVALVLLALSVSFFLSGASLARHLSAKASLPGGDRTVQCVLVDNGTVYAGTEGGAGVYKSTNNGDSWQEHGSGLGTKDVLAILRRGDYLLAGTWSDGGVYRRSATDTSWSSFKEGMVESYRWIRAMAIGTGSSPVTYAADPEMIYQLPWGSSTWQAMPSAGLPSDYYVGELFVDDDGRLHAGLLDAGVYSYAAGSAWTQMGTLGRSALAMDYGPDGNLWVGTSDGVYRWSGSAWAAVSGTSGWDVRALKRNPLHPSRLFVGLSTGAVYRYQQSTGAWTEVSGLGIPSDEAVWSLAFGTGEPQRLFVGADDGLYYTDIHHPNLTLDNDPDTRAALSDGDLITYTVGFQNVGTSAIAGVVITSHIPAENVTYVDASDPGTKVGQYVRWSVGSVGAELTEEVTYTVRVELGDGGLGTLYSGGEEPLGDGATANTIVEKPHPDATLPPPTPTPVPPALIINDGAYATWQGGPEDGVTTDPVYNWINPHRIYLPLVMKNHGGS